MILAGDLNLPNINWHSDTDVTNEGTYCEFQEILKDYYLTQVNLIPTRGNNVLDLIITSFPDKVKVREILSPEILGIVTDHHVISFEIDINPVRSPKNNESNLRLQKRKLQRTSRSSRLIKSV